jgi:hypothetical protein
MGTGEASQASGRLATVQGNSKKTTLTLNAGVLTYLQEKKKKDYEEQKAELHGTT